MDTAVAVNDVIRRPPADSFGDLTPPERRRILDDFNATDAPLPESTLVALFERQIAQCADRPAVTLVDACLTYRELDARANRLARKLIAADIGPGERVAIALDRSPRMIVAILAALKAGAAYVPLDPAYPPERLAFMLGDARPRAVLTTSALRSRLPKAGGWSHLELDSPEVVAEMAALSAAPPGDAERVTPLLAQHTAYLIYTSGSTGRPKGVAVSHLAAANSILARRRFYGEEIGSLFFSAPISFDISVAQIFWTLGCGAELCLAQSAQLEPARRQRLTHLMLPAPVYANLLTANPPPEFPALRCVIVGGEALSPKMVRLHHETFPGVELVNEYGLTEAAVWSTAGRCLDRPDDEALTIGGPIANTRVYVLDAGLQPCGFGATGELYIAGLGLARGYWRQPALTAERFVANPFARIPGERLYRTGDLASWRVDGQLLFHGRSDEQVKVRGFRIEPSEIEAVLLRRPEIAQAAVVARAGHSGDRRLIAYLVPAPAAARGPRIDVAKLRRELANDLPDHLVPEAYMVLEALPLTANGKLDRQALPGPRETGPEVGKTHSVPYRTIHYQLIDLWRRLLGVREVDIQDDFFALGGNSLLAMRLLHQLEQIFGRTVLPVTFFKHPTIEHLSDDLVRTEDGQPTAPRVVRVNEHGARTPIFFLHGDFHGGGFYAMELSRRLGPDQPFYVLGPAGVDDANTPPTIQELAAAEIEDIRKVRPQGPYVIGGFCLGGLIGLEVARQLAAAGESVERLLVIDAPLKNRRLCGLRRAAEAVGRRRGLSIDRQIHLFSRWFFLLARLERWVHLTFRQKAAVIGRRLQGRWQRAGAALPAPSAPATTADGAGESRADSGWYNPRLDVPLVYFWSAGGYRPEPYAGAVTVMFSQELFRELSRRERLNWVRCVGAGNLRELMGSHLGCITEHVDALAETIARCLAAPDAQT